MRHRLGCSVALLAVVAACGGSSEPVGPPAALTALTAGPFTDTVGTALGSPLQVRVTDASGRGVAGIAVRFAVASGSGTVSRGAIGGTAVTDSTDAQGNAEATWTLGTAAGQQGASASADGLGPVEFEATALAGPPATVEADETSAFIAAVSAATDEPLAVRIADAFDNPVGAVLLNWAALSSGATVSASSSVSDADGIATIGVTLGSTPGLYLFRATLGATDVDTIGVLAVTIVTDPEGDQTPTLDPAFDSHDVTRFGALVFDDVLVLYAKFAGPIGPVPRGQPNRAAMIASYDLDLDGDSLTGFLTLRQCLGGPPLGIGVDAFVDLNQNSDFLAGRVNLPPGAVAVLRVDSLYEADRCNSDFVGAVYPAVAVYQPTSVSMAIPLAFLQDDGGFALTTLFAHPGTGTVTDIVPDSVAWQFTPTVVPGPAVVPVPAISVWEYLTLPRPSGTPIRVERWPTSRRSPPR